MFRSHHCSRLLEPTVPQTVYIHRLGLESGLKCPLHPSFNHPLLMNRINLSVTLSVLQLLEIVSQDWPVANDFPLFPYSLPTFQLFPSPSSTTTASVFGRIWLTGHCSIAFPSPGSCSLSKNLSLFFFSFFCLFRLNFLFFYRLDDFLFYRVFLYVFLSFSSFNFFLLLVFILFYSSIFFLIYASSFIKAISYLSEFLG